MKKAFAIFVTGMVILLVGCVTLDQRLKPRLGHTVDELVEAWGPPSSEYKLSDGRKSIQFVRTRPWMDPIFNTVTNQECRITFIADQSGIIRSYRFEGRGC